MARASKPSAPLRSYAWAEAYQRPNSRTNPTQFWVLPDIAQVIRDFRACAGQPTELLKIITGGDDEHSSQLLFLIYDELAKPENKGHLIEWGRINDLGDKVQMRRGTDEVLGQYRKDGTIRSANLLQRLGENSLPGTFAKDGGSSSDNDDTEEPSVLDELLASLCAQAQSDEYGVQITTPPTVSRQPEANVVPKHGPSPQSASVDEDEKSSDRSNIDDDPQLTAILTRVQCYEEDLADQFGNSRSRDFNGCISEQGESQESDEAAQTYL